MERTHIKSIKQKIGEKITIKGFVETIRQQGSIAFLIIRDVTGRAQVVVLKSHTEAFDTCKTLTLESVVCITGLAKEEKQAPNGFEIEAEEIMVLSLASPELPIPVVFEKGGEETDAPKRFDYRWIDLRKDERINIFKVWTELEKGVRKYTEENNFIQVYAPSFMGVPSESGAEVFEVNYFDRKAYLAQSPQFYKQMAMAAGFEKVFITGPIFRAEPSYTTRHMTEFTGWDFELSYIESHHDVMDELEKFLISGFEQVNKTVLPELEIPKRPFPRVTMKEAKELLRAKGISGEKDYDVSPEEERELGRLIKEQTGSDFVFLIDYPANGRAFYHMRYPDQPDITKGFDLIYKGLEIVTGAQREHRYEVLEKQAKEKGMDVESLRGYMDFFKYGCPPHGGVGIGPGRIIMQMLDLPSVKEATLLPRDVKRINP
ncbi:aspartate--tRNA(Asn) ligase [candidate division WWE3 bacterium RIFOXYC1_FULL_40_10]|uniref:Aspartate--tRNA(Asp/Asn) ligase n=1 Tax=candidate division WWE3 bacterium RIFOXYA2_FULL_46_9 TaxID=1802636 RepID=A0A1F4VYN5_UNCKA|nr:MAG: aspartate--tRNA(Asn) ligase [candidate division WWE3 bacterium RIFOXYB1_FULL_40_22]OGC61922.1 MAG: aspartate--tRNA(Asn) ligase [candidate division WWE3 bacterium RIFOXYA1_FULL_40_11]OGC62289.1 MAG: aspartate--tRNA(Asn) ligase [candidate division WWE3 bacterium RIFOXYA2_FULL_46_9]OGC65098.1 MAG: aspartate--tRNA(Asn) ligase [candidate division WWE3 bacterium RIFOXYB2_FULL_41_6]OGC66305.1 MAG: aspartate--tRNA(Asn) ligase [candidate division WWE3 bacterium RIFOXYC1_FULL_40_10]OGC67908.1 MA